MYKLFTTIILLGILIKHALFAQEIRITPLFDSSTPVSDSSYYDAVLINKNQLWFIGKNGVITQWNNNSLSSIYYPHDEKNSFLSAASIDTNRFIFTCNNGIIYHYNSSNHTWKRLELKEFKNKCFYSVMVINPNEILICGGNSKIINSKKAIPKGFIIKSDDGGYTWKKVHSSFYKMYWRIKKDENGQVWVNAYSPNKSLLLVSKDYGKHWKYSGIKTNGLIHDFYINNDTCIMVGGKNIRDRNTTLLFEKNNRKLVKNNGFAWHITRINNFWWIALGNAQIAYKSINENDWQFLTLNQKEHLNIYKLIPLNNNCLFAIGSGKRIYKIEINK